MEKNRTPMASVGTPEDESNIGESFADIREVESVYVVRSGDVLRVYTVVDDTDEDGYDRIYAREQSIIRDFKSTSLSFDFNVISRRGRDVSELVNFLTPAWRRKH